MNSPPELVILEDTVHWIGPSLAPVILRALGPSAIPRLELGIGFFGGNFSKAELLKIFLEIERTYPDCKVYFTSEARKRMDQRRRGIARSERRRR